MAVRASTTATTGPPNTTTQAAAAVTAQGTTAARAPTEGRSTPGDTHTQHSTAETARTAEGGGNATAVSTTSVKPTKPVRHTWFHGKVPKVVNATTSLAKKLKKKMRELKGVKPRSVLSVKITKAKSSSQQRKLGYKQVVVLLKAGSATAKVLDDRRKLSASVSGVNVVFYNTQSVLARASAQCEHAVLALRGVVVWCGCYARGTCRMWVGMMPRCARARLMIRYTTRCARCLPP